MTRPRGTAMRGPGGRAGGLERPVERRQLVEHGDAAEGEPHHLRGARQVRDVGAGLEQRHAPGRIVRQARGEDAARGATADDERVGPSRHSRPARSPPPLTGTSSSASDPVPHPSTGHASVEGTPCDHQPLMEPLRDDP